MGRDLSRGLDAVLRARARANPNAAGRCDRHFITQFAKTLLIFSTSVRLDNVHPLQTGVLRLKHPSERRPGLPRLNPWIFWSGFAWDTVRKHAVLGLAIVRLYRLARSIRRDPEARAYMDQALTPVRDDEDETLALLTQTTGAKAAAVRVRRAAAERLSVASKGALERESVETCAV